MYARHDSTAESVCFSVSAALKGSVYRSYLLTLKIAGPISTSTLSYKTSSLSVQSKYMVVYIQNHLMYCPPLLHLDPHFSTCSAASVSRTLSMVLSPCHNHCKDSDGLFDQYRTAPNDHRSSHNTNRFGPQVHLRAAICCIAIRLLLLSSKADTHS